MPRSIRKALKTQFPNLHKKYVRGRHKVTMEYKVVRQIGVRSILRGDLWRRTVWRDVLPIQAPQKIVVGQLEFASMEDLVNQFDLAGLPHADGGNAVYFPPAAIDGSAFRLIRNYYPADAGLKIVRDPGDIATSQYVGNENRSSINKKLTASHGHMTLAANLLHSKMLGPRMYDLVELEVVGQIWTAYVVQHVEGRTPTMDECQSGIRRLQALEKSGVTRITLPGGYKHKDFTCPKCNGNALIDAEGEFHYVDFQNFILDSYEKYIRQLAEAARQDTHFGPESVLWGGRFLYQSIPCISMPSRRKIDQRFSVIDRLMAKHSVSVQGKVVLDIGCNIGMAMAEYMKRGAKWCHGWDRQIIAKHAVGLLPALGCTRFSLTGGELHKAQSLENDVAEFIRNDLDGCVISYLAVRLHVGWLDSLKTIKWSYMIYEEHQGDDFESDMNEFSKLVDFEILEATQYSDGLSGERTVAILKRSF